MQDLTPKFSRPDPKILLTEKEDLKEIPRAQRYATRPALAQLLKRFKDKGKDQSVCDAHVLYGYKLKEIAEYLKVHYSTVSRIIKRGEGKSEM